jgi:SAP domain
VKTNKCLVSLQDEIEAAVDEVVADDLDLVSQLDPKNMKVAELRAELDARNLPSKGKPDFMLTLSKALTNLLV